MYPMMHWSHSAQSAPSSFGKVWLGLAFLLVAGLAFEAGMLRHSLAETEPLVVAVPNQLPAPALPERTIQALSPARGEPDALSKATPEVALGCAFVGSKKSNKYHKPSSRCAKQIKTENRICFESTDAAKTKGYLPGCLE